MTQSGGAESSSLWKEVLNHLLSVVTSSLHSGLPRLSMVIFPITEQKESTEPLPMWTAIEQRQKQVASAYWIVTQPSHAALAGDLAAALRDDAFGPIDATVARCIALHDSGWSMEDAAQIQLLRTHASEKPSSFLEADVEQFLPAWTKSIETAAKFAPVGGYIVSRHFERISGRDDENKSRLDAFRKREKQRQQKLRSDLKLTESALEGMVDALQFCDVLSLYLCCGASVPVKLDKPKLEIKRTGEEYRLHPSPFRNRQQFSFSALRHPVTSTSRSGATFYINL